VLFNSYEFLFAFLPTTVAVFLLLGRVSRELALSWLIIASLLFYAWWRPLNVLIIAPSIAANYLFARALLALARDESRERLRTLVLAIGVAFNIGFLGYFKYANFAVTVTNDITGTDFILEQIILPLGISFITFQKIAFLVDVAGRRVTDFTLRNYLLFVLFFPQLIAGPIVHYRESIPQFLRASCRFDATLFATGLTLFTIGLFKKVILADGGAQYVSPVFEYAASGGVVTLLQGWEAAIGFTLQIYFDFSAYSDMACGAALLFGVRLPLNFDSPLKASNIIEFWLRWHVTLTRFLTAYLYNPITLALTRRRAGKGQKLLRGRGSSLEAFVLVLVGPTLFTMLVSGVWHGAGYTFVIWGLLHGGFLVINHTWRQYTAKPPPKPPSGASNTGAARLRARAGRLAGFALTFAAVAASMVFFRAPNLDTALPILEGMIGVHGVSLPNEIARAIGAPGLPERMLSDGPVWTRDYLESAGTLAALLAIALLMPNSLQLLSRYQPVLQTPTRPPRIAGVGPAIYWSPSLFWMAAVAAIAVISVTQISGESEFLYWQF
jgi:D-alanyl-lipoteichoic acid acyltransferase DltB (MBOAT superfamily)